MVEKTLRINSSQNIHSGVDISEPIHAPGILEETLTPEQRLGPVDPATVERAEEEKYEKQKDIQGIPPIHQVINIDDFEVYPRNDYINARKSPNKIQLLEHGRTTHLLQMTNFVLPFSIHF